MAARRTVVVAVMCLPVALVPSLSGAARAAVAEPRLELRLIPKELRGDDVGQLVINVRSESTASGLKLELEPPPGFRLDPVRLDLPASPGEITRVSIVRATGPVTPADAHLLRVDLRRADGGVLVSKSLEFAYRPELPVAAFLTVALLGITLGYGLRLLIKVLGTVEPPSPAPLRGDAAVQPTEGPITRFVRSRFYWVDYAVTAVLGLLALLALAANQHLPDVASTWPPTLVAGVGLGLLTNSELVTRLRPK